MFFIHQNYFTILHFSNVPCERQGGGNVFKRRKITIFPTHWPLLPNSRRPSVSARAVVVPLLLSTDHCDTAKMATMTPWKTIPSLSHRPCQFAFDCLGNSHTAYRFCKVYNVPFPLENYVLSKKKKKKANPKTCKIHVRHLMTFKWKRNLAGSVLLPTFHTVDH